LGQAPWSKVRRLNDSTLAHHDMHQEEPAPLTSKLENRTAGPERRPGGGVATFSLNNACEILSRITTTGDKRMDILLPWVVTIAVLTVGLTPGLAILSTSSIARLLYRALGTRPKGGPEPRREEPARLAVSRG